MPIFVLCGLTALPACLLSWEESLPFGIIAAIASFLAIEHSARSTAAVIKAHRECARQATAKAVEDRVL